jgi:hypothetical protein
MASKVDFDEYLHGEGGVDAGLRGMLVTKQYEASKGPYTIVLRFYPPGSSGYSKAAEIKIANRSVFDVGAIVSQIEKQVAESLGDSPIGRMHLIMSGAGGAGVMFQRQRQIAPSADNNGNLSIDMLRGELSATRAMLQALFDKFGGAFAAQTGLIGAQAQALAAIATQRSVSSSAADAGGLHGLLGMVALVFAYPMIKESMGLPKDATAEDVVKAVQVSVRRWGASEERGIKADAEVPKIPESAVDPDAPPGEPKQITTSGEIDVGALLSRMKDDPGWRDDVLKKALEDPEFQKAATLAFVRSQK